MTRRKDSARSWLVLSVATFGVFIEIGVIKSFSVLLPDLKEQLDTQTWICGSSISLITGIGYLLGLTSGSLVKVASPRVCVMVSGLIATLGLIGCSLATSPPTLLFGLILTGFLLVQENVLIGVVPEYFDKYFKAAVGIYACGTGLGIVILPLVTQTLLDIYGWRGALLILSALCFHFVSFGALLTPSHRSKECEALEDVELYHDKKEETDSLIQKATSRDISHAFGFQLLTQFGFVTEVVIPGCVWGYTIVGWMIYMVFFAVSIGLTLREGTILATSGGVGVVTVRLAIPLLHKCMNYKNLLYVASIVLAISLSLTTVFDNYIVLHFLAVFFGLGIGCLGGELYISAKVNSKDSDHYFAIAWLHVAYGSASILSGVVTGLLYDLTGSFTFSFNILAAMSLVTVVSLGLADIKEVFLRSRIGKS